MQKLYRIIVSGLSVKRDFTAARRRLLGEFSDIQEVVATTAPGTLLVLCAAPRMSTLDDRAVHSCRARARLRALDDARSRATPVGTPGTAHEK